MATFDNLNIGTRRRSSVSTLNQFAASPSAPRSFNAASVLASTNELGPASSAQEEGRRSVISLTGAHARRRSSVLSMSSLNNSRRNAGKDMDEPILLSKEESGYLFFSASSDGMLNYKTASRISGSMTSYLVDPTFFNRENAPVVVLSSPKSGNGSALQTYQRLLLPILKHFQIDHSHIALSDAATATYLAQNGQFTPNTIFILLSGDGVIHEVVNGLAQNPHFEESGTPVKICPIPCGSGNGLASSLKMTDVARSIRALFKNSWAPFPVMRATSSAGSIDSYASVVVSYGLHAALVDDSASPEFKEKYGNNRFKEAANKHLRPQPYLYKGRLSLINASRLPTPSGESLPKRDIGDRHTYVLITRCSSLEPNWRIAPMASPTANPETVDVVRMADLSGAELGRILMDAYKNGAHVNDAQFEYNRATLVTFTVDESAHDRTRVCIDGAIYRVKQGEQVTVTVSPTIGNSQVQIQVPKLS